MIIPLQNQLILGDCLEKMKDVPDNSIDLVLTDLPYGVTQNTKDIKINLESLFFQLNRISKNNLLIMTAQFPFTIDVCNVNRNFFKYDLVWDKILTSGFLNANRMPLRVHENILVFYDKSTIFNPQKTIGIKSHSKGKMNNRGNNNYGKYDKIDNVELAGELKNPKSIINISKPHPSKSIHPTQKPVELFEYLIKTYTNENDLVLDCCAGSGTTAIACINTKRNYICIEKDENYFNIMKDRVSKHSIQQVLI